MTIETEIAALTVATTDLITEVVGQKTTLAAQVTASAGSASAAAASAANAAVSESNAAAVVTGGTASLTPAAGLIPLADGTGKIANGWLPNNPNFSGEIAANGGIALGDNDKATFGDSDDLQIYHDGSHSRIADRGTGDLRIYGDSLQLNSWTSTENYLTAVTDGAVAIYYNGAAKLATTATGIDVTGTATMDGLTVDGQGRIEETGAAARFIVSRTDALNTAQTASIDLLEGSVGGSFGSANNYGFSIDLDGSANSLNILSGNQTTVTKRLSVARDTGDISFYEDTGTTPKFFWDASKESLGIGTNSITPTDGANIELSSATSARVILDSTGTGGRKWTMATGTAGSLDFYDYDAAAYRLRISSAGRVGIGTSSPSELLHVSGGKALIDITSSVGSNLTFKNYGVNQFSADKNYHEINFITSDVSSETNGGYVRIKAGQEVSGNNNSSYLGFWTAPNGGNVAEAMRITSAGFVGIGTSSPDARVKIVGDDTASGITLRLDGGGVQTQRGIVFAVGGADYGFINIPVGGGGAMSFGTGSAGAAAERARIDASGRVLINKPVNTSALNLEVQAPTGFSVSSGFYSASTQSTIEFKDAGTTASYKVRIGSAADDMIMFAGGSERMRINSAGNVLVGKTSGNVAVAGAIINNTGDAYFTRDGNYPLYLNRLTSDGTIAEFRKDGTTVGSIGNTFGRLFIGSGNTGIRFIGDTSEISPWNTSTNSGRDSAISLGNSGNRFKDLYLSGGVYLGGTGAANKLDDYEAGTWTPTASSYDGTMTVTSATYVKVGKLVTVKANVSFDATVDASGVSISSLPFATTGIAKANGGFVTSSTVSSAVRIQALGSNSLFLLASDNSNVTYTTMANTALEFILIYEAV